MNLKLSLKLNISEEPLIDSFELLNTYELSIDVLYSHVVVGFMYPVSTLLLELLELITNSSSSCHLSEFLGQRRYSALLGKLALLEHM